MIEINISNINSMAEAVYQIKCRCRIIGETLWYGLLYGIQNLFIWLPYMWLDRDWDYIFMFRIFAKKFERMERLHRKYGNSKNSHKYAKQLMICKNLCKRIASDDYFIDCDKFTPKCVGEDCGVECPHVYRYLCLWNKKNDWEREEKMQKRDIEYLCEMIKRNALRWWD